MKPFQCECIYFSKTISLSGLEQTKFRSTLVVSKCREHPARLHHYKTILWQAIEAVKPFSFRFHWPAHWLAQCPRHRPNRFF